MEWTKVYFIILCIFAAALWRRRIIKHAQTRNDHALKATVLTNNSHRVVWNIEAYRQLLIGLISFNVRYCLAFGNDQLVNELRF